MFELLVCIAASIGAGTTAGLAGISTATVISPLLIALLGFDAYEALGIALAADVLPPLWPPLPTAAANTSATEKACWC